MKKSIIIAAAIFLVFALESQANTDFARRVGGYFYTSLSPHGTWIEIGFGTPVWRPTIIKRNWSPYYYGQWIYSDYGWYWDSYEPFGSIVYHYGRWYYDDYYGWIWIPDYEWAPAWVEWRYDDHYIGWAPMSPYVNFSISIGLHYSYDYYVPYNHWRFIKYGHFGHKHGYKYYVSSKYNSSIYERTKYRTNYSYYNGRVRNDGVDYESVRSRSGRNIQKRNLVAVSDPAELTKRGSDREVRTYIAKRDDISRDEFRDIKVERGDRKTSLELSKIELGRERNNDRSAIEKDRNKGNNELRKTGSTEDSRVYEQKQRSDNKQDRTNEIKRSESENQKKLQERKEVEKRSGVTERRNNEQIQIQKKSNDELKKRNDSVLQQRNEKGSNPEINRQDSGGRIEKKQENQIIEQRKQNTERINRSTDVKRNDNKTRTENKKDRTEEKNSKTRNR